MDISQDSVFWGQGQCVSCSNLQYVFTKEIASPAALISSNCAFSQPGNGGVRRWQPSSAPYCHF